MSVTHRHSNDWDIDPKEWWCLTNLTRYPFNKWVYFRDIPGELFQLIWNEIEHRPNIILSEDGSAFKKVHYINHNRLGNQVLSTSGEEYKKINNYNMSNVEELVDAMIQGFFTLKELREFAEAYHEIIDEFGPVHTVGSYMQEWLTYKAKENIAKRKVDEAVEYYNLHKSTGLDHSDNSDVLMKSIRIAAGLDDSDIIPGKTYKKETFDPNCCIEVSYEALVQFARDARNYSTEPRVINIDSIGEYFNRF